MTGKKTGGRTSGTPNRATNEVRRFLDRIFRRAFADERFEQRLVASIVEMTIDPKMLALLLAHYVGRPAQAVDVTHGGTVNLADIITGRVPQDEADDEEDATSENPETSVEVTSGSITLAQIIAGRVPEAEREQ